jgi:CO/xanthine dehydrogenase FAD-binding subunit
VLIALEATYTLIDLQGSLRHIPAQDFQTGPQQTLLQPGEALRSIWIPAQRLRSPSTFQRLGITQTDPALVIVAGSRDPDSGNYRFGLNAALSPHNWCGWDPGPIQNIFPNFWQSKPTAGSRIFGPAPFTANA